MACTSVTGVATQNGPPSIGVLNAQYPAGVAASAVKSITHCIGGAQPRLLTGSHSATCGRLQLGQS